MRFDDHIGAGPATVAGQSAHPPDPEKSVIRHLVVGPDRHGVVSHGQLIAAACGHEVVRALTVRDLHRDQLSGAEVIHLGFTGPDIRRHDAAGR